MESPPRPPAALRAPWLLGLLLWPWTLRLAGRVFLLLTCSLAPRRAAVVRPPARAANSSLGGICWLRLNVADFAGEALGTRRCLANASPRWLSKGRGQRSPLTAVFAASLPARPDLPALKQGGRGCWWAWLPPGGLGRVAEVNGKGQLKPKECCGGTAPNLPSGRATLSVSQGEEGRPAAGHQEPRNLGRRTVTVSRKGGTSHFLKYNQRPHYYLHKRRPFQGPTLSPRLAPGPPQKLSGLGPSQDLGWVALGWVSSSGPENPWDCPSPAWPTPGSLEPCPWAALTL